LWLIISIGLILSSGAPLAYGDWSQEWIVSYRPEKDVFSGNSSPVWGGICCPYNNLGTFTQVEFFIMPDATPGVTFEADTRILGSPKSFAGWTSVLPNSTYSLLAGPEVDKAYLMIYFSGPRTAKFELDMLVWDDNKVVEREEFKWLGGHWQSPFGTLLPNVPGQYDRTSVGAPAPVPPSILLFAPAGLWVFLLRRRFNW
jgi:hypothetical protein